jgi:tetratricopeptide (TPR) repeat protein
MITVYLLNQPRKTNIKKSSGGLQMTAENPASITLTVDTLTQLTRLVASNGIYALVILYMFFQQREARNNLSKATKPEEKRFFERQLTIVTWATLALSIAATVIWFYATFVYHPKIVIEGTLKNLKEQATKPENVGDPPMITYRLGAFRGDVKFFSLKQPFLNADTEISWVLISPPNLKTLELTLQQEYGVLDAPDPRGPLIATLDAAPSAPRVRSWSAIKTARIDFESITSAPDIPIHLVYRRSSDSKLEDFGNLAIDQDGIVTAIPWVDYEPSSKPAQRSGQASVSFVPQAWAAENDPDDSLSLGGKVDDETVTRLRQLLESENLAHQVLARDILVRNGSAAIPTIKAILEQKSKSSSPERRSRLVHNLSDAAAIIQKSGADQDLKLTLGQALFETGDYKRSAEFFGNGPLTDEKALFNRGIANLEVRNYAQARKDLESFASITQDPKRKSLAHTNLGTLASGTGDPGQAKAEYGKALRLDPRNAAAFYNLGIVEIKEKDFESAAKSFGRVVEVQPGNLDAQINRAAAYQRLGKLDEAEEILEKVVEEHPGQARALNNLAYVYTQRNRNLQQALAYADQATRMQENNPRYLDTKGWVLYRMGNPKEALPYIQRAAKLDPSDPEIQGHLVEIQKTAAAAR